MTYYRVNCSKGQTKIQQMAFVLVAIFIFFAIVALFYFSVSTRLLESNVEDLREQEVIATVRKIAGTPEFVWSVYDCASCVDLDKIFVLKDRVTYQDFWKNINFLKVERVHPKYEVDECIRGIYPLCNSIVIVDDETKTVTHSAFVSLCRYDNEKKFNRCELGKIVMGFETVP